MTPAQELRDPGPDEAADLEEAADLVAPLNYDGSSRKNLHYQSWNRRRGNRN